MSDSIDSTPTTRYATISILLHWLTVIGVIGLMASGIIMVDLSYYSAWYTTLPYHHKAFGVLLIGVVIARLMVRWTQGVPDPIAKSQTLARFIHSYHGLLYGLLALVLFSGYLIPTNKGQGIDLWGIGTAPALAFTAGTDDQWLGEIHEWGAYIMSALAILHALAALKQHFFDRSIALKRMLGMKT
jgi:cytochrome b561